MISRARSLLGAVFGLATIVSPALPQTITEFALPSSATPGDIAAGPDGNLWFTEFSFDGGDTNTRAAVGRITPTGSVTEFVLPLPAAAPVGISSGPDGNLWITQANPEFGQGAITRLTPAGNVTQFAWDGYPWEIVFGPDGNLWFTEAEPPNRIGRITTAGVRTEFRLPSGGYSLGIATGSDGNLWVTQVNPGRIGRMTPSGNLTQFAVPFPPGAITTGPDGNLWFVAESGNTIGRITPAGVLTAFEVPTPVAGLRGITAGPDGNIWFTERTANKIGRITLAGVITEFPLAAGSGPDGITSGPDDAVWFTESGAKRIGRITTGIPDPLQILPVVGSTGGVGTSFFRTSVQLHNAGTTPSSGRIVFHPSGVSGSESDPALDFTLAPGQTQTIPDLLPAMGSSGLGSADISLTSGSAGNVPIVSARVFNDAGTAGTSGFAFNALAPDQALSPGRRGVLTIPLDLTNFRMNIGVRTLAAPVLLTVTVRDAAGAVAATVPKFFPATYHEQQAASAFLNGLPLPAGGSITALVEAGNVVVYGATVDNRTGDPSLQIAATAP